MATKVTLRDKPNAKKDKLLLYLDFYPAIIKPNTTKGETTRREMLHMAIHAPIKVLKQKQKNGTIKEILVYHSDTRMNDIWEKENFDTKLIAESIRIKRQNDLNKPEIYTAFEKEQLEVQTRKKEKDSTSFVEYFKKLTAKREGSNGGNWISAYHYLVTFVDKNYNGELTFEDLNEDVWDNFKDYLSTVPSNRNNKATLAVNSTASYFTKIKAALRQAHKDSYLQFDLNAKVNAIKGELSHRDYLTREEIQMLIKTDCSLPHLKQAALLSIYCGMRHGDIEKLVWGEIELIKGDGYFIKFITQKTDRPDIIPISNEAFNLLGERGANVNKVFSKLKYSTAQNKLLSNWLSKAGITKEITFHCFRHTFAMEQIREGTDVYTLQKMLGHAQIKTTEIYAKVLPAAKRKAANLISYLN